jgi:hypothetical protein
MSTLFTESQPTPFPSDPSQPGGGDFGSEGDPSNPFDFPSPGPLPEDLGKSFLPRLQACAELHPARRGACLWGFGPAEREFAEHFLTLHPSRRSGFLRGQVL